MMKKGMILAVVIGLIFGLTLSGCGTKKAASGKEAINIANAMETTEKKVNYLISQAKAFYNSEEFQDAIDVAQHVLRYLDKESQPAKNLLEQSKTALIAKAKDVAENVKKGLSGVGK